MYHRNRYSWLYGLGVILAIVVGILISIQYTRSAEEVSFTVLSTEVKGTGSGDDYKEKYLISVRLDNGQQEVFESTDTMLFGKWNSSDVYFELKNNIGAHYTAEVAGWRVPFLSWYRNIVKVKKIE